MLDAGRGDAARAPRFRSRGRVRAWPHKERQRERIEAAKKNGVYKGGGFASIPTRSARMSQAAVARELGCDETVQRALRKQSELEPDGNLFSHERL